MTDALSELQRRFIATLARTQWMAPAALRHYQARLLSDLLSHAATQVPFYRGGRLAAVLGPDGVDLTRWHEVPILTRQEARTTGALLRAETVPEVAGAASEVSTSGSIGSPFTFLRSAAAAFASRCCGERHYHWLGVPDGAPIAVMRSVRDSQLSPAMDADAVDQSNVVPEPQWHPQVRFDTRRRDVDPVVWLAETGARHLVTYPTYARALARDMQAGRSPAVRLDLVLTFGEVLAGETRAEIETAFGARVADRYASEEGGMLAGECDFGNRHIQSEINLVEVVDEAGRPVPPGVEGRVVITPFYNYAMPFIRYAIGDRAVLSAAPCRCGRQLPLIKKIAGRSRHLFRFADGRRIWPMVPFAEVRRFVEMRQLQIVQVAHDRVVLHYVPEGDGRVDRDGATALVRRCLGVEVAVDFVVRDEIPRLPGGKYHDYVSLVPPE